MSSCDDSGETSPNWADVAVRRKIQARQQREQQRRAESEDSSIIESSPQLPDNILDAWQQVVYDLTKDKPKQRLLAHAQQIDLVLEQRLAHPDVRYGYVFIDATPDDISTQLQAFVPFWSIVGRFPYAQGILVARCTGHLFEATDEKVVITGYYCWRDENNQWQCCILGDLVTLKPERLREARVKLVAKWSAITEVEQYVSRLFGYLVQCWPEIAQQLVKPAKEPASPISDTGEADPEQPTLAKADGPTQNGRGSAQPQGNPWEAIPDGWHREAVRLWWEGYNKGEIAKKLGGNYTTKYLQNVFWQLRTLYGMGVVPTKVELMRRKLQNRE